MGKLKKRIILIFLVFLILLSTTVKAEYGIMPLESISDDRLVYRFIENRGYNEEKKGYEIYYRIYNEGGLHENSIYISNDMYNRDSYFIIVQNSR